MVDELTPTCGVDSDNFPGYSMLSGPISVYTLSITVLAHSYSISAPNRRACSPQVLRTNVHRIHPQVLRASRLDVCRRPRPIRPAGTSPELTPLHIPSNSLDAFLIVVVERPARSTTHNLNDETLPSPNRKLEPNRDRVNRHPKLSSPLQATPFSLTDQHKTLRAVFGIGHTFTTR